VVGGEESGFGLMDKMFNLPVVNDTYDSLTKVPISYLQPYMEVATVVASPAVERAFSLKADVESKVPEVIQTRLNTAKDQVAKVAASVDATLCSGVDQIVEKVPALKQPTPDLYNTTVEGVGNLYNTTVESFSSRATEASAYLASFTIAHILLKASDAGLETADSVLKWTGNENAEGVMKGLRRIRDEAATVRKSGVERNGSEKSKVVEEASLAWAVVEVLGIASYLNYFGDWRSENGEGEIEMVADSAIPAESE